MSSIHKFIYMYLKRMHAHECLHKCKKLSEKDHQTKAGIEPTSSDDRSATWLVNDLSATMSKSRYRQESAKSIEVGLVCGIKSYRKLAWSMKKSKAETTLRNSRGTRIFRDTSLVICSLAAHLTKNNILSVSWDSSLDRFLRLYYSACRVSERFFRALKHIQYVLKCEELTKGFFWNRSIHGSSMRFWYSVDFELVFLPRSAVSPFLQPYVPNYCSSIQVSYSHLRFLSLSSVSIVRSGLMVISTFRFCSQISLSEGIHGRTTDWLKKRTVF